jgi:hypothetical protein
MTMNPNPAIQPPPPTATHQKPGPGPKSDPGRVHANHISYHLSIGNDSVVFPSHEERQKNLIHRLTWPCVLRMRWPILQGWSPATERHSRAELNAGRQPPQQQTWGGWWTAQTQGQHYGRQPEFRVRLLFFISRYFWGCFTVTHLGGLDGFSNSGPIANLQKGGGHLHLKLSY